MKKGFFKKVVKRVGMAGAGVIASAGMAMAEPAWIDVSGLTVDTAPVATLGLTVLAGLASIWGLRKLVKSINRS